MLDSIVQEEPHHLTLVLEFSNAQSVHTVLQDQLLELSVQMVLNQQLLELSLVHHVQQEFIAKDLIKKTVIWEAIVQLEPKDLFYVQQAPTTILIIISLLEQIVYHVWNECIV